MTKEIRPRRQIKTILKKKKRKKAKWLSEEALQIAEKRREAKGKGEKERYPSFQNCEKCLLFKPPSLCYICHLLQQTQLRQTARILGV